MPVSCLSRGDTSAPVLPAARQRGSLLPNIDMAPDRESPVVAPGIGTIQVAGMPSTFAAQCEYPEMGVASTIGQHASANRSTTGLTKER